MLCIESLRVNGGRLGQKPWDKTADFAEVLELSWSAVSDGSDNRQAYYRLKAVADGFCFDSGEVASCIQRAALPVLPQKTKHVEVSLTLTDVRGEKSKEYCQTIFNARTQFDAQWLKGEDPARPACFGLDFEVDRAVKSACLYACGLGYHKMYINGEATDDCCLEPIHTDYSKTVRYSAYPTAERLLKSGKNRITAFVAGGWRHNRMSVKEDSYRGSGTAFGGDIMFAAQLEITYADGETRLIATDESWQELSCPIVSADMFDGETYDNRIACGRIKGGVGVCDAPEGRLEPNTAEHIKHCRSFSPRTVWRNEGRTVYDFGQNICGVVRIALPQGVKAGQSVTIRYAEELDDEGGIAVFTLRKAKATDCYIASGNEREGDIWQPLFTYHGFRYVELTGDFEPLEITAIELRTSLESLSSFTCGSALASRIHDICVNTERANQIGILTDCPQRDERQGWLNDATVRFEETPYNFDIGRLFPKILSDIADTQEAAGNIKDTAPYVMGDKRADPVCSSFLVAAWQNYMHTGNIEPLKAHFEEFERWENYLLSISEDGICTFSNYGDWAGPHAACKNDTGSWQDHRSKLTPGEFMSTGYMYFNAKLLSEMAENAQIKAGWLETAKAIRKTMLDKWYDAGSGKICTASQGCQSFALWLGIIPEADRPKAAKLLADDLNENGLTTGNLCSRYILDVLTQNGYADAAWGIITNENYPSIGYMLQNEATTVWERFELKTDEGMNSHNHPMYGAMDYWFWAYLLGIKPTKAGWTEFSVKPYFPKTLLSASGTVKTAMGDVSVRWVKRFGLLTLWVQVPFGAQAEIEFDGCIHRAASGLTILHKEI